MPKPQPTVFRSPYDGRQEEFSDAAGISWPPDAVGARQEFREEADINVLLKRYGAFSAPGVEYGERDLDLDLQSAYGAIAAAREAFLRLPEDQRRGYTNWWDLLAAVERGEFDPEPSPPPAEVPSAGGGDAPPAGKAPAAGAA